MNALRNSETAKIYTHDGQLICKAVVCYRDDGDIVLSVKEFEEWEESNIHTIEFMNPTIGIITCECQLYYIEEVSTEYKAIGCHVIKEISRFNRRQDLQVNTSIDTYITYISHDISGRVSGIERVEARITNISAGGVFIETNARMNAADLFVLEFTSEGKIIQLDTKVLRVRDRDGDYKYGYGCQFYRIADTEEAHVREYVFKRDRDIKEHRF